MPEIRFIINGKLVKKEKSDKINACKHDIVKECIDDTNYRFCKHCGMLAHEDGAFHYMCGSDYCRCSQ